MAFAPDAVQQTAFQMVVPPPRVVSVGTLTLVANKGVTNEVTKQLATNEGR